MAMTGLNDLPYRHVCIRLPGGTSKGPLAHAHTLVQRGVDHILRFRGHALQERAYLLVSSYKPLTAVSVSFLTRAASYWR